MIRSLLGTTRVLNTWLLRAANYWSFVALVVVFVAFVILSPDFLTRNNWIATTVYMTGIFLLAVGQTFVIVAGGIDLSVGGVVSASGIIGALAMKDLTEAGASLSLTITGGVVVGALVGLLVGVVNGLLVARLRLASIIVTLGMMGVTAGVANLANDGQQVTQIPAEFARFGSTLIGNWLSPLFLTCVLIGVIAAVFLAKTRFGMRTYALGSSPEAARRAGINVSRHTVMVFSISGVLAGLTGVLMFARFGVAQNNAGQGMELLAIAAVVIGGASIFGGKGTISGSIVGVAIMSMLVTGLILSGVQPFWQTVVTGVVIIVAVYIDQQRDLFQERLLGRHTEEDMS